MALDVGTLKAEILKILDRDDPGFVGDPADGAAAATNWANAFDAYAINAEDISGDAVATVFKPLFETTLAAALNVPPASGSAASAAAGFGAAHIAYWTSGIFAVGTPPPPVPPGCPNVGGNTIFGIEATSVVLAALAAALIPALTTEFGNLTDDVDAKADALANALHTACTTEVTVLISGTDTTPPPAGPLPITNTCTVF